MSVNEKFKRKRSLSDQELFYLSWPIFVELFLRVIIGNINVFMISNYSEPAVAAVGASNQLLNLTVFIYGFVSVGTQIIISQLIGAKKREQIPKVITTALAGGTLLGLLISATFILFPRQLLFFMNLPENIVIIGVDYLRIFGGSLVISAVTATIIAILRSHGETKVGLYIPMVATIIAVIGNYIALYGPFGLPHLGVMGLGISSVVGNSIGLIIAVRLLYLKTNIHLFHLNVSDFSTDALKQILALGLPSSGESLSYQASQVVVTMIVASLGQTVLIAKSYVQAITQFVYLIAASIAQGNQIIIGRKVGAKEFDFAYERGKRSMLIASFVTIIIASLTYVFAEPLMQIFTSDAQIIEMAKVVFLVDIFLELGRAINMVLISSLNAAGDVKFPLMTSLVVLWLISLPFSYGLAIVAKLGLLGVWLAYAIDELLRSAVLIRRWKSGSWRTKSRI